MGAYQDLDSEDLLGLVVIGRTEALEEIYDRYSRPVYSLVLGLLREPAIAEEVTQEVFLRVWLRSSSFKPLSGKAKTWILSIAHHRAIDRLRQQRHRQKESPLEDFLEGEWQMGTEAGAVEQTAILHEESVKIQEAMKKLPEEQRQVLMLGYFRGFTQAEISKGLNVPLGTVKTRMRLGIQKLRQSLAFMREEADEM
ncbi:MAG: sigma-70 family RNA polymerase sigma factor [Chloroflexi bacterium]|nr:sigma-70 family RNA polymerase sigma factor [Chloroflexota bacterium]